MEGQRVANYRIVKPPGEVGMGVAFKAARDEIRGRGALKVLRGGVAANQRLAAAHAEQAAHRDLKPANVVMVPVPVPAGVQGIPWEFPGGTQKGVQRCYSEFS